MTLKTTYLGLELPSPLIVASSPFTTAADKLKRLEDNGAGAVVLKSLFEEQLIGESAFLERYNEYPEAADYLRGYISGERAAEYTRLIEDAKRSTGIPVIASINCQSGGTWVEYARAIESAGADALELNIFLMPTDEDESSGSIESRYLDTVESVTSVLRIPVSVKLGNRFTNIVALAKSLYFRGAQGVVMFNRFFEPDIDIDNMELTASEGASSRAELRNNLRSIALCSARVPSLDIAVSTGVHTGDDAVKAILAGARAVQLCSALYKGLDVMSTMNDGILSWMEGHGFDKVSDFSGYMNEKSAPNDEMYQRAQYMKYFPKL